MDDNYYAALGLPDFSNIKEIRSAYRKLAMQWHPDRNQDAGAQQKFIRIQLAYDFLKDAERRRDFDEYLKQGIQGQPKQQTSTSSSRQGYRPENVEAGWQEQMKSRAEKYANMPYEEFLSTLSKEIKLHVSYIPNILAMLVTGSFATIPLWIGLQEFLSIGFAAIVFLGIFCGLFVWLTVRLFKVMMSDYEIDRKKVR